ncbi:MAG: histidinol dehydrogenase [Planctomycetota bacterium]
MLRAIEPEQVRPGVAQPFDAETIARSRAVVEAVRDGGEPAVREQALRFGELEGGGDLVIGRDEMLEALQAVDASTRGVLERTADRIRSFAESQRDSLGDLDRAVPGGRAGHTVVAMDVAGCYAPGGRYPLPSSVLMTAVPARVAGVSTVVVATPGRDPVMRAAAAVSGADLMLCVGGAHAIAAMAYGVGIPACDVIVGPGNRWVTAAKHCVSSVCAIDMLAGPSELLVIADGSADPATIAADLLAQAEHDPDALPCMVTTDALLPDRVNAELECQLASLPTAETARAALANGWSCPVGTIDEAVRVSDLVAPEHLEILTADARGVASRVRHAGGVFIGSRSAEVLGDYGIGPNHTLPTGRTARARGGLSVLDFLRVRTWLDLEDPERDGALPDAIALARIEGLEAHARSAERRLTPE